MQRDRWENYKIEPHERPNLFYTYYVTGRGRFPMDMLRHDLCWPATSEDADKLTVFNNGLRSVKLNSYKQPTIARWVSFLWSVGNKEP